MIARLGIMFVALVGLVALLVSTLFSWGWLLWAANGAFFVLAVLWVEAEIRYRESNA